MNPLGSEREPHRSPPGRLEPLPPTSLHRGRPRRRRFSVPPWLLSGLLFAVTFFTTTTLGPAWTLITRTDVVTDLLPLLSPRVVTQVWTEPALIRLGLSFSIPVLLILLSHELGHYLACRHYGLRATPPYFLPLPVALGTLGAFIRIRSPIRSKRELFDVGIAGPLAGFFVLLPFLVYGVARSAPASIHPAEATEPSLLALYVPGHSLGLELVTRFFHGPLPPDTVLNMHPFALAAWVGMLVTAFNLLPLAQLDGGHILYSVSPRGHRLLGRWLWIGLLAGAFVWFGWVIWAVLVLFLGLRHPPVVDETTELSPERKALAFFALLIFLFCFMPRPLYDVPLAM